MPPASEYVYLDYNSTTPLAPPVGEIMSKTMIENWGNPSSDSILGREAKQVIEKSRLQIAQMIGGQPEEIIFTSGGTEANNMIIRSAVEEYRKQVEGIKPHVITSTVEHDATSKFLDFLVEKKLIVVTKVPLENDGTLSAASIISAITQKTCLITIMMANNETGIIFPISNLAGKVKAINEQRKGFKILMHTDAAQAIGKIPVDVNQLNVDYITIVGHKFYGPRIGCVYFKKGSPLHPLIYGGGQERGFRSGTENTHCIAGLGEAARLVSENLETYVSQMSVVRKYLENEILRKLQGYDAAINFYKVENRLSNTVSVAFPGKDGKQILERCKRLLASTGAACHQGETTPSKILLQILPYDLARGTLRLSVGRETTQQDIDNVIEDLSQALRNLK